MLGGVSLEVAAPYADADLATCASAWEVLRSGIASGDAQVAEDATGGDRVAVYCGALRALAGACDATGGDGTPSAGTQALALKASAGLANVVLIAARRKRVEFLEALAGGGAVAALIAVMSRTLPQKAYLGCAKAIHVLCASSSQARKDAAGGDGPAAIATTLGWCVLGEGGDGKMDGSLKYKDRALGGELFKVCYAVAAGRRLDCKDDEDRGDFLLNPGERKDDPAITLIGLCLRAVLCGERGLYEVPPICLDAVNLLTCAPKTYYAWFVENNGVHRLCNLLEGILVDYLVEEKYTNPETTLPPILDCLMKICQASPKGKRYLKEWIFPAEDDARWMPEYEKAKEAAKTDEKAKKDFDDARMHPADAPKYSCRAQLIKLMCETEVITKRLVSELLYLVCDEDANEFILRCGMGSAIAFLQIKKLMPMPKSSV